MPDVRGLTDVYRLEPADPADGESMTHLITHLLNEHDETPESLCDWVDEWFEHHPRDHGNVLDPYTALDAMHTFQTDSGEMGDWDPGHTHDEEA